MKPEVLRYAVAVLFFSGLLSSARAVGDATWETTPTSSYWYSTTNWTPENVPNTINDTATFGVSSITTINEAPGGLTTNLGAFVFTPGASAYTIDFSRDLYTVAEIAQGVTNDSGVLQIFSVPISSEFRDINELNNVVSFINSATAGALTQWTAAGSSTGAYRPAEIIFNDSSTAASGTFIINPGGSDRGGEDGDGFGGIIDFRNSSTAGQSTINVNGGAAGADYGSAPSAYFTDEATAADAIITMTGGTIPFADGGVLDFYLSSSAGNAQITNEGGAFGEAKPGQTSFHDTTTASNATIIADAGVEGASGGLVQFWDGSTGESARLELFGNGTLDISFHSAPGVTVGSIEGDGRVTLGANRLTTGANRLSTTFSGVISGTGSLAKIGSGTLTLTGPNTYSGATQVSRGKLLMQDRTGSLMIIRGNVSAAGGAFGGSGRVGGAVIVGTPSGRPGTLEANELRGGNFIIQKSLTFNSAATYQVDLNSDAGRYSNVSAEGVTISEGAFLTVKDIGNSSFGPVNLTIIVNTSSQPIAGEFANLPEGGSITVGMNTFYASYHGGNGNDFTLTTVPPQP